MPFVNLKVHGLMHFVCILSESVVVPADTVIGFGGRDFLMLLLCWVELLAFFMEAVLISIEDVLWLSIICCALSARTFMVPVTSLS